MCAATRVRQWWRLTQICCCFEVNARGGGRRRAWCRLLWWQHDDLEKMVARRWRIMLLVRLAPHLVLLMEVRWLNTASAWRLPWLLVPQIDAGLASFTLPHELSLFFDQKEVQG
ncbi:hypothetical protein DEO72_LG2g3676 [Vigna unguiculata]|uniref:Uncharacterized protein n=1 Tax=Vigna unguiculata TaxID=3917 RepID=A0A4D6L481_VIGUN|nr:hypothetical protein DEO72_LG2g3676 [Vigna unguiculata]